jgi:hypothetical protein
MGICFGGRGRGDCPSGSSAGRSTYCADHNNRRFQSEVRDTFSMMQTTARLSRMRRIGLYFLPAIAAAAIIFGLFYIWIGIQTIMRGESATAAFLFAFGIGGLALGSALWSVWRKFFKAASRK